MGPTPSHAWRCRSSVDASAVRQRICARTAADLLSLRAGRGLKQGAGTPLALLRRASGSFVWFIHGCRSRRSGGPPIRLPIRRRMPGATEANCNSSMSFPAFLPMELIEAHHRYRSAAGAAAALGRVRRRVCGYFVDYVGNKTVKVNKENGLVGSAAQ